VVTANTWVRMIAHEFRLHSGTHQLVSGQISAVNH